MLQLSPRLSGRGAPRRFKVPSGNIFFEAGGVRAYLGEELSPDGLNVLNASGLDERLELIGLEKNNER